MYRLNRFLRQLPAQVLLLAFTLIWSYPFIWIISSSFKSQSEMFLGGINIIPKEPTLDNFVRAWDLANFTNTSSIRSLLPLRLSCSCL